MIKRNTSQICLWVGMVLMLAVSAKASTLAPGTWTQTGNLNFGRYGHTATLLPNGKVLVAGGANSSELYDPSTGTWTQTGNLNFTRSGHTATLLPNGKVLVAGGAGVQSELYDPSTGTWAQTGNLNFDRFINTATLLPDGKVLVAGGAVNIPTNCDKWGCHSSTAVLFCSIGTVRPFHRDVDPNRQSQLRPIWSYANLAAQWQGAGGGDGGMGQFFGVVRPFHRDVDPNRQSQQRCPIWSYGNPAAQWQGAGGGRGGNRQFS